MRHKQITVWIRRTNRAEAAAAIFEVMGPKSGPHCLQEEWTKNGNSFFKVTINTSVRKWRQLKAALVGLNPTYWTNGEFREANPKNNKGRRGSKIERIKKQEHHGFVPVVEE